jgi:branched-chain amino acid transport system permease protein
LFGLGLESNRAYLVFLAACFAVVGLGVVWLRLGSFGRRLQAMKDSPAACATLGINLTRTKVGVFMLSAAIAGFGGVLLAGVTNTAQADEYSALQNLPIVLMAAAGGIAVVSGSLVGGLLLASFTIMQTLVPDLGLFGFDGKTVLTNVLLLAPAIAGVSLGRDPNGMVALIGERVRVANARRIEQRGAPPTPESLRHSLDIEPMGIDQPFTDDALVAIDAALGLDDELASLVVPVGASAEGADRVDA